MIQDVAMGQDVFASAPPDEETEPGALAHALQMSVGYSVLLVRCNLRDQQHRLMTTLRARAPHLHIQEIEFREPIRNLLCEVRKRTESG